MKLDKMYVVRKYVKASSVAQALRLEPKAPVHEVFIDEKWQADNLATAIGFLPPQKNDEVEG